MIDAGALTAALKKLVLEVEDDLRARVDGRDEDLREADALTRWRAEYDEALTASRTGRTWTEWRDDRVTQAAVAWVLTTVFVRFCEDNGLVSKVWIAGPTRELRQQAQDARTAHFREQPADTDREWLLQPIEYLRSLPATRDLVESHSALWLVAPSGSAAERILAFWHERGDEGELRWDFTDPSLSTRFLGDLYQDLSEHAKSTYALLQTPEFVEEFILDRTLTPALDERPLAGFKLIDPTCGSGHFLLGAFTRLLARWQEKEPATNAAELAWRTLDSVYGVDLNAFAVAITRFRLLVAALHASEEHSLENARNFPLHLAVGDSLLHGRMQRAFELGAAFDEDAYEGQFAYSTEDLEALRRILSPMSYDVVVGNPPYITVKDKILNSAYRGRYDSIKGKYALTVPFMERFFQLARPSHGDRPAGWIGQITSNSFMKREFGTKLVEDYLPTQDLRLVVDTSGAYIPGHGTPTVILVGRPRRPFGESLPLSPSVRAVLGIRGEPGRPDRPAEGLVWRSIIDHVDQVGNEDAYTSTVDLPRRTLESHPWSLSGGGADQLLEQLQTSGVLRDWSVDIGMTDLTGEDDALLVPVRPKRLDLSIARPVVVGDEVRDFAINVANRSLLPRSLDGEELELNSSELKHLWPNRTTLRARLYFGQTPDERGYRWFDHAMYFAKRHYSPLSIAFAFVATHNHFVLDRGGKVFKQSAPVIKLPEGASEDDHLALLGVLNSSTACFWLKQNSHDKGNGGYGGGIASTEWERFYEFTGTTLKDFPLPGGLPVGRARRLDLLAERISQSFAQVFDSGSLPADGSVAHGRREREAIRGEMVATQEELDWEVYTSYGISEEELTLADSEELPRVRLGERAFEIALARKVAAGSESSAWFERHGSTPTTEIPAHWPAAYRDLVQRRLDLIDSDRFIGLLERPEYKRRWAEEPWEKRVNAALRTWLLDRLEARDLWFDRAGRPRPQSAAQLADRVGTDADFVSVLALWAGRKDVDVATTLEKLLADEVVPYLAAHRLKDSGLRKRVEWERTWDLQRAEDRGEKVGAIPVPPKYTSADFRKQSVWSHRGKLDVPKERFISYPGGGRATDTTTMLGWAGWDHAQQSLALATLIQEREHDGAADEVLVPLVAGMAELQPWVDQWHDEDGDLNLAEFTREVLRHHMGRLSVTADDLHDWRPPAATRGRRRTTKGT